MNAAALKLQMHMAEEQFDAACIGLRRARIDFNKSRSQKRLTALTAAEDACDMARARFKRAASVHSKALAAEVATLKARAITTNAARFEMFAGQQDLFA